MLQKGVAMSDIAKTRFPKEGGALSVLAVFAACAFYAFSAGAESSGTIRLLEYIESSGTQCINTAFSPLSKNVKIEMTYRFVSLPAVGSRKYVFGSCQDNYQNVRFQYAVGSAGNCAFGFGDGWVNNATVDSYDTNTVHTIVCDGGVFTLDGNVVQDQSSCQFQKPTNTNPVYLLANNNKGSITTNYSPSVRLYSCRIWDDGVLVRDFVPALDGNSKACLCDILRGRFYYNVDRDGFSGDFTAGEVVREISLSYRTAAYIEADQTAFIDTGYVPTGNTKFEMAFAFTKELSSRKYVFGTYGSSGRGRFMFSYGPADTGCFLGYGTNYQGNVSGLIYNTERHVVKYMPGEGFYFDGDLVTTATVDLTEWVGTSKNLFLGTCNRNGAAVNTDYNAPIRIYYCKIWEDDELKRDLVPKQRQYDGKNGLYDNIDGGFYGYYGSGADFTASIPGMVIMVR